jgi:hypothetical protein
MKKYVKENGEIQCAVYDDETYVLLAALGDDRKPLWLDETSDEVRAYIDLASERERDSKKTQFQMELDRRMEAAVAIASPLDYANKRKKLPADKAARLAALNNYIDQLASLEYSEAVEWPVQPE